MSNHVNPVRPTLVEARSKGLHFILHPNHALGFAVSD
jgi:hypothetical protein